MKMLITYDIVSTKIRNRLIDKLFDYGFQRIQNSIFIGDISSKKIDKFVKNIEEIIKLWEDSVYLFSICEEDFKNGIFLGKFIENKKEKALYLIESLTIIENLNKKDLDYNNYLEELKEEIEACFCISQEQKIYLKKKYNI